MKRSSLSRGLLDALMIALLLLLLVVMGLSGRARVQTGHTDPVGNRTGTGPMFSGMEG